MKCASIAAVSVLAISHRRPDGSASAGVEASAHHRPLVSVAVLWPWARQCGIRGGESARRISGNLRARVGGFCSACVWLSAVNPEVAGSTNPVEPAIQSTRWRTPYLEHPYECPSFESSLPPWRYDGRERARRRRGERPREGLPDVLLVHDPIAPVDARGLVPAKCHSDRWGDARATQMADGRAAEVMEDRAGYPG